MYKTLVRSHLDYCDITYHIPPLNSPTTSGITFSPLMEKGERTHYQTALAITGTCQRSSRTKLYEELGWERLPDRRWSRSILQIHKIRNQNNFHEINCKTSRYKNSFFPNAVSIWNKMITDFQDIPSFSSIRAHTYTF